MFMISSALAAKSIYGLRSTAYVLILRHKGPGGNYLARDAVTMYLPGRSFPAGSVSWMYQPAFLRFSV